MFNWIRQFRNATFHTQLFIFNWALYTLLLLATTIYCYARMDFTRSRRQKTVQQTTNMDTQSCLPSPTIITMKNSSSDPRN